MSPPRTLTADLLHDGQATLAEGPRWDSRTDRLIWVDILAGETHFLDPATGTDDVHTLGRHVGAVLPRASGGYVACVREGFCTMTSDGHEEPLYVLFDDELRRMNDGRRLRWRPSRAVHTGRQTGHDRPRARRHPGHVTRFRRPEPRHPLHHPGARELLPGRRPHPAARRWNLRRDARRRGTAHVDVRRIVAPGNRRTP